MATKIMPDAVLSTLYYVVAVSSRSSTCIMRSACQGCPCYVLSLRTRAGPSTPQLRRGRLMKPLMTSLSQSERVNSYPGEIHNIISPLLEAIARKAAVLDNIQADVALNQLRSAMMPTAVPGLIISPGLACTAVLQSLYFPALRVVPTVSS